MKCKNKLALLPAKNRPEPGLGLQCNCANIQYVCVQIIWAFEEPTNLQLGVEFLLFSWNQGAEALRARSCFPASQSRKGCEQTAAKQDGGNGTSVPAPSFPHRGHVVYTVAAEGDK